MSVEGCALQILRACGISSQHLFTLLQPYSGQLPQTDAQFNNLCQQLRRHGHITEGTPGNIATSLHGPPRQARPGSYAVQDNRQALRDATQRSSVNPGMTTFLSHPREGQGGSSWDTLLPTAVMPDPFTAWADSSADGGERTLEASAYPVAQGASIFDSPNADTTYEVAGAYFADDEDDSLTSSATSSDDGDEPMDLPDLSNMGNAEAAEIVFYQYRNARRVWRRFTGKPVRRFRRDIKKTFKRAKGKGKGKKGRGFHRGFFYTGEDVQVFLKGKGKGARSHTSGKGHGRQKNPKDRDGNTMKCRICNSDEHLMARCPQNTKGKGKGPSGPSS